MPRVQDIILRGTRANQPAANSVATGSLYYVTDENVTERSNGSTWDTYNDSSGAATDHGLLLGLSDDDHAQYLLASAATSRALFATNWTDLTDTGATTLHSHSSSEATDVGLVDGVDAVEKITDRILAGSNVTITELADGDAISIASSGSGGDASTTTYTPGDLDKWDDTTDPGATSDGLDQLAKRLSSLERTFEGIEATKVSDEIIAGANVTVTELADGSGDAVSLAVNLVDAIEFIIDGGGSAITTGIKGDLEIPFGCTINRVTTLADQSGSIVIDIWKDTYANYPPTVADTITASAKPTISTATKAQDSTLTGWTTAITAGDTLRFNVDSITTCTRVVVSLKVTRT